MGFFQEIGAGAVGEVPASLCSCYSEFFVDESMCLLFLRAISRMV